jgi:hypothetical protein
MHSRVKLFFSDRRLTKPLYRRHQPSEVIVFVSFRAVITVTAVVVNGGLTS